MGILYQGKYLRLVKYSDWEYVERNHNPDVVAILPILNDKNVVLIKEYRVPISDYIFSIPAGLIDFNENSESAAHRELKEETGYLVNKLQYLSSVPSSPGLSNEIVHFYLANISGISDGKIGVGTEDIQNLIVSMNEITNPNNELVKRNMLDTKVYTALCLYNIYLGR